MENDIPQTGHPTLPDQAPTPDLAPDLAPSSPNRPSARMERIKDYETHSLAEANPLLANLGSVNSGLMRLALRMEEVIVEALQGGSSRLQRLPQLKAAIENYLRVTRQIDRFAQLSLRTAESQKQTKGRESARVKTADSASPPRLSPEGDLAT